MVSIIIPALNEADALGATLERVREQSRRDFEVIVVDGGSTDATVSNARAQGASVIEARRRQRAAQMNFGANAARGEALLFLHADTLLPVSAVASIQDALQNPHCAGGAFSRRFDSSSLFLRWTCSLAGLRNQLFGWHLGDQAIFARRSVFDRLGGFPELDRFEDLEFSRALARTGTVVTLRPGVVTSARRFARRGPVATTFRDFLLTLRYLKGDPRAVHYQGSAPGPTTTARQ